MEKDGTYRLLTMPSMFEMGFNYVRWYYKTEDDMLIITNYTLLDAPEVRCMSNRKAEFRTITWLPIM